MPEIATACYSFRPVGTFEEFAAHVSEVLDRCAGADLVLLPELVTLELMTTLTGWQDSQDITDIVGTATYADRYRDLIAQEAGQRGQYIVGGSFLAEDSAGRLLNISPLADPQGRIIHEHAKSHLFPMEFSLGTSEGDQMTAVELPFAVVGITICYEAEIPECSASLVEQGAQILLCPSLTFSEAGFWRVRHCLAARAIENQVFAAHSGSAGAASGPYPGSWARSSVLGPCDLPWPDNGILAETPPNEDAVARVHVDLAALAQNRETGAATTYRDRRRRVDLYRTWPSHITNDPTNEEL